MNFPKLVPQLGASIDWKIPTPVDIGKAMTESDPNFSALVLSYLTVRPQERADHRNMIVQISLVAVTATLVIVDIVIRLLHL